MAREKQNAPMVGAVAADAAPKVKLFDRVGQYWDGRHASGQVGLILLDECIKRAASKNRDWDALARFVSRSINTGNKAKVLKIVRVAFGDKIKFTKDTKHPAGGRFELMWEGAFPLRENNAYGHVAKAIATGKGWDSADFLKSLNEVLPEKEKAKPEVTPEAIAKAAKHVTAYIKGKMEEGFSSGDILAMVQKELAK